MGVRRYITLPPCGLRLPVAPRVAPDPVRVGG
jgi:hypothetical protein